MTYAVKKTNVVEVPFTDLGTLTARYWTESPESPGIWLLDQPIRGTDADVIDLQISWLQAIKDHMESIED